MISIEDVKLAREVGCTCRYAETRHLVGQGSAPIPGMSVTRTQRLCRKPPVWLNEFTDVGPNGSREDHLGAACAEHHEQIVSGEYPLDNSSHQPVTPDWYRLPADPAGDEEWVAQLVAAAEREDHAMDEVEVPERVGANDRLEVFPGKDGKFYFRRIAEGNSEPIARGQGYTRREDAVIGARRAFPDLAERVELVDE